VPPAIAISHLSHNFAGPRGPVAALRDLNLDIEPGEFFGLFGPNGAGKTTLIRILTTLILPSAGSAAIYGHDVVRQAGLARAHLGLVFSNENSFYGRLTGRQNLEFFAALQNLSRAEARRQIDALLELFDLSAAGGTPFQYYSTGMRQKLNVTRALLHDPPVLFLDEPTKGMDVLTAETLRRLLREELVQRRHKTVLLTTHDLEEMEALCDRVGILDEGQLRAMGEPAALIRLASASVVYRLELAGDVSPGAKWSGETNGLADELGRLAGVRSVAVVTRSAAGLVLDLVLDESPTPQAAPWQAALWQTVLAHGARVRRYGPKDDGLVTVLKQSLAERNGS
jgi:ABC-2 type transport system ATP-binding protein